MVCVCGCNYTWEHGDLVAQSIVSCPSDSECLLRMPVGVLIGDRSQLSAVQLRLSGLLCTLSIIILKHDDAACLCCV